MQFSNSLAGTESYDRLSTPKSGKHIKSRPQVQVHSGKGPGDGLAYTGFSGDIPPKGPSKSNRGIRASIRLNLRREKTNK